MNNDNQKKRGLTERNKLHLALAAIGYNNSEIGKLLHNSIGTVKKTLGAVYMKLNVKDRTCAVSTAWKTGILNAEYIDAVIAEYGIKR